MSILIRGMAMPSCCMFCFLSNSFGCGLAYPPIIMTTKEMLAGRPDWCPLIYIPPHGRLIDADEFLKRAIGTKCFRGDYALMLEELVGESTTITPAEEGE